MINGIKSITKVEVNPRNYFLVVYCKQNILQEELRSWLSPKVSMFTCYTSNLSKFNVFHNTIQSYILMGTPEIFTLYNRLVKMLFLFGQIPMNLQ